MRSFYWVLIRLSSVPISIIFLFYLFKNQGENGVAINATLSSVLPLAGLVNLGIDGAVLQLFARLRDSAKGRILHVRSLHFLLRLMQFVSIVLGIVFALITFEWLGKKFEIDAIPYLFGIVGFFLGGLQPLYCQYLICNKRYLFASLQLPLAIIFPLLILFLYGEPVSNSNLVLILALPYYILSFIFVLLTPYELKLIKYRTVAYVVKKASGYSKASIYGVMAIGMDYLILSVFVTAEHIAEYNVTAKFYMISLSFLNIWLQNNNIKVAELNAKNSLQDLSVLVGMWRNVGATFLIFYLVFISLTINIISGYISSGQVSVDLTTQILFSLMVLIRFFSDLYYSVLHSCNCTSAITRLMLLQACISLLAQSFFVYKFGYIGIVLGISISFLLTQTWYLPMKFYKYTTYGFK